MESPVHPYRRKRGSVALTEQAPPAPRATSPAAHAVELRKTYGTGQATVHALAGIDVTFERGRFTAVMGPSGSGKSTLMHCMAGLDRPTSGQSYVGDVDIGVLDDKGLTQMRRDHIGFVFQSFNLVPTLTAGENITLPVDLAGGRWTRSGSTTWWTSSASPTGWRTGREMSGGQQQRCACARALINRPDLVFADRPPGTWTPIPRPRCCPSCAV